MPNWRVNKKMTDESSINRIYKKNEKMEKSQSQKIFEKTKPNFLEGSRHSFIFSVMFYN